jgi:phage gp45-like
MVKGGNEGFVSSNVASLSRQTTPSGLVVGNGGFALNGKLGSSGKLRVDSSGDSSELSYTAKGEGLVKRHFVDDE